MVRVVLAEDSYISREGVKAVLDFAGMDLVGVAESYDQLMSEVSAKLPDVVVTDIRMPPTQTDEGIRAARSIRGDHPDIGVVVLSQYVESRYALALFSDGADGLAYLLKERIGDPGQLEEAVERVTKGESMLDPRVVEALVTGQAQRAASKLDRLTPRETEVLTEIAEGKSNRAIATSLTLSERAIEKHINAIFTKLDLLPEGESNRRVRAVLTYLAERKDIP
ncbi:MAG: response regulator transcription factor [Acidimicrobiales bacterium]